MAVPYVMAPRLVRGLDYYTRTAFEIQTAELGTQNAVAGGGRYDNLVAALGGPGQPAIGFAIGLDRLVDLALTKTSVSELPPDIFIAAMGAAAQKKAFAWSCELGRGGIKTEIDFSDRSLKALMKRANRMRAKHVLMVGDQELKEGRVVLRNMRTKEQTEIGISGILSGILSILTPNT